MYSANTHTSFGDVALPTVPELSVWHLLPHTTKSQKAQSQINKRMCLQSCRKPQEESHEQIKAHSAAQPTRQDNEQHQTFQSTEAKIIWFDLVKLMVRLIAQMNRRHKLPLGLEEQTPVPAGAKQVPVVHDFYHVWRVYTAEAAGRWRNCLLMVFCLRKRN